MSDLRAIKPTSVVLAGAIGGVAAAAIVVGAGWQLLTHHFFKRAQESLEYQSPGYQWPVGGTASTIVKVQGGAMSFRTEYDWVDSGTTRSCTPATGPNLLSMTGIGATPGSTTPISTQVALNPGWFIDMKGRDGDYGKPDNDGLTVSATNACGTQQGILLSADLTTDSFYSEKYSGAPVVQDDSTFIRRFHSGDTTCSNDRDRCEHMSTITVTAGKGENSVTYPCIDGECSVFLVYLSP